MNFRIEYCRLSATAASFRPGLQPRSSVDWLGPIRDAQPGNLAGMHAIGGVLG